MKYLRRLCAMICVAVLLLSNQAVCLGTEGDIPSVELFSGNVEIPSTWSAGAQIFTTLANGTFEPGQIVENGYIFVAYTGDRGQIILALQDATTWEWKQLDAPSYTEKVGDVYVSAYSYKDMAAVYGTDFSNLGAINVYSGNASNIVLKRVTWGSTYTDEAGNTTGGEDTKTEGPSLEDILEDVYTYDETLPKTVLELEATDITAAWTLGPSISTTNSGGTFDPTEIARGGYFAVDYTGAKGKVYLAFSEWGQNIWASVNTPSYTIETENGYRSYYNFTDCAKTYGDVDLSEVDAICIGTTQSTGTVTITGASWFGESVAVDLENAEVLFKGSSTASSVGTNLAFFFTKHVGGEWDASVINQGSYFYVEYEGARDGIYLAFMSASGATQWVAVYPDDTGVTEDGRYYSIFSYDNFSAKFGTNFVRLDQIQAYAATNEEVTLKRIAYFAGEGDPVDTSDGTWDRPTTGIAFIGDSIVQNPLVDTQHLKGIDWNGILGRTDCVNYGIGGQTTKELLPRIGEVASKDYEKVVFLCGINDIGKGLSNATIKTNYASMIETLTTENPDIEIFIISVLPTTDAFYTNMQNSISGLNVVLFGLCQEYDNVTYVDCYSSFVGDDRYCKEGLTFDGLHPNLEGYSIIAGILNPYLNAEKEDTSDTQDTQDTQNTEDVGVGADDSQKPDATPYIVVIVVLLVLLAGYVAYKVVVSKKAKKN